MDKHELPDTGTDAEEDGVCYACREIGWDLDGFEGEESQEEEADAAEEEKPAGDRSEF